MADNELIRPDVRNGDLHLPDLPEVSAGTVHTDTVSEATAAAGVTVDGVLLKDGEVTTDVINEATPAAGVTVDGVVIKDGRVSTTGLDAEAPGDLSLTSYGGGMTFTTTGPGSSYDIIRFRTGNGSSRVWTTFGRQDGAGSVVGIGNVSGTAQIVGLLSNLSGYTNLKLGNEPSTVELAGSTISMDGEVTVLTPHGFTANAVSVATLTFDGASFLSTFTDTTTESLTFSGPCTATPLNVSFTKIGPIVHVSFQFTYLAGNSIDAILTSSAFSAPFRPTNDTTMPFRVGPGTGVFQMGAVNILTTGVIRISASPVITSMNTAGTIVIEGTTVSYNADM